MNTKSKEKFVSAAVSFALFVIYTVLAKVVDVQAIGPENTEVGFASVKGAVAKLFPYNNTWYELTEWLGYIALGVCLGFALFGLMQLVKGKSLKAVDKEIWVLAGFYAVVIFFYALFEKVELNYRPVILDEGLEASYPSSHTVLALCVFISAIYEFNKYIKNKNLNAIFMALSIAAAVITVIGRLMAGVHWVSDIIGGLLLSVSLLILFQAVNLKLQEK